MTILALVLMLAATEISIACNLPWLDCRPYLVGLWKFIEQKIPWDGLRRLPGF